MENKQFTMRVQISGLRNNEPWPGIGGVIMLPDAEGAHLVATGAAYAGKVKVDHRGIRLLEETATAPQAEKATARGRGSAKKQLEKAASTEAAADADGVEVEVVETLAEDEAADGVEVEVVE